MAMVKSGWLHRQSKYISPRTTLVFYYGLYRGHIVTAELCFFKAPYFGGGRKTGLTFGVTGGLSSTMISNGVTWRMTSTWGWTALTFATLPPAMVLACQNCCALSILLFRYRMFYNVGFSHSSLISLRVEPTRREDARCFAPDSLPRWTNHQPVCGQCRWCPVRCSHTDKHTFFTPLFSMILLYFTTCRAWTMALQDARINTVSDCWMYQCFVLFF